MYIVPFHRAASYEAAFFRPQETSAVCLPVSMRRRSGMQESASAFACLFGEKVIYYKEQEFQKG
jgi:hypothetical protein